jgi:hypothetical protein
MSDDPAAMLNHLFAIPQKVIDAAIAEGELDPVRVINQTYANHLEMKGEKNPALVAEYHHKQMVRARVIRHWDRLPEEARIYMAGMIANVIAEDAVMLAHDKDTLSALNQQIREIEKREGLEEGEYWPIGEGPEDYQRLNREATALYDKVHDTVFTTVLRRYQLDDLADMYEETREEYERIFDSGRVFVIEKR